MKIEGFGVFLLICVSLAQDDNQEEGRELRGFNEDWRAIDFLPPRHETSGWVPTEFEEQPKRRRLRKRKRRPPVYTTTEETFEPVRRRSRPQRLDQIKQPWQEMNEETNQKTNNRRRLTPVYDEIESTTFEKIRDPFTALQEAEEKQKTKVEEKVPDLKTILKQSGGLSLSEVLQEKNLTLAELLNGSRKAISAIAKEAEAITEIVPTTESVTYRRLPPSIGLKKDLNKISVRKNEGLTSHEVMEAQKKRLALLHSHKESTETTTEKNRKLPMTSAKFNKMHAQTSKIPDKAVSININEILLKTNENSTKDGPLKMIIDLEEMVTDDIQKSTEETKTTTLPGDKLKHVTAKEELMEILKNPQEREHLSRILRIRNMTVEELVALRERGSSQLHLADIFHNKTKEPEPVDEPFVGHIQTEDAPFFRKGKTMSEEQKQKEITTKLPYTVTSFPTYKIETNKNVQAQVFLPIWKQLYPQLFSVKNQHHEELITSSTEKMNEESDRLNEIENALAEAANGQLQIPQNVYDDDEEFISLPSGVKSAILASLAIVGLSLLVFLTILLIFKWTQKQKRLNYNGSFSSSKIKTPILEPYQKRTFRTFVSETLGKKRNYYKTHIQSMSDSIWDRDEKKPYLF